MRIIEFLTELGEAFEDLKKEQDKRNAAINAAKNRKRRF